MWCHLQTPAVHWVRVYHPWLWLRPRKHSFTFLFLPVLGTARHVSSSVVLSAVNLFFDTFCVIPNHRFKQSIFLAFLEDIDFTNAGWTGHIDFSQSVPDDIKTNKMEPKVFQVRFETRSDLFVSFIYLGNRGIASHV